jgi:hypothetical protein
VRDRELERLLRDINGELAVWMETAGPRSTVTAALMPGTLDVEHLRERFYDPDAHLAPPPLEDVSDDAPEPPSLHDVRRQGGPLLYEMRDTLVEALTERGAGSVGDVFNGLDATMRRPVEILGLLQIAAQLDAVDAGEQLESFNTVRPDGSRRTFTLPRIVVHDDGAATDTSTTGAEND